jgi:hypothetical protein
LDTKPLQTSIAPEQLDRIKPLVDRLLAQIRREASALPPDADSALIYQPETEEPS